MKPVIAVLGTFDTKGMEYGYIDNSIKEAGGDTICIDICSQGKPLETWRAFTVPHQWSAYLLKELSQRRWADLRV